MTGRRSPTDLAYKLGKLGWSNQFLARQIGVHPNTVSKWVTGRSTPPKFALAFIDLSIRAKELWESIMETSHVG